MVMPASDALSITVNTIISDNNLDLQTEIGLAESKIRNTSGAGLFSTIYDAKIIGNPNTDPRIHTDLLPNQEAFYTLLVTAGYVVGLDSPSGRWFISWDSQGSNSLVAIYTLRTTIDPSAIIDQTIGVIEAFFLALVPVVHTTVSYNGFIDEAGFGGVTSIFFEFTIVADQGADLTNHSAALKTVMINQGIGYLINNCAAYMLVT